MQWFGGALALAVSALMSPATAAPQIVAGVEIDYSLPLVREPKTEDGLRERVGIRGGPPMRSVEVHRAPLAWDIGDGQGHVQIARIEFETARNIDDAVREMGALVTDYVGEVFRHAVSKVSISGLDARQMSFEKDLSGWRFGGELLVVSDPHSNTIWQIQVLFARRPLSASLDEDRKLASTALASVRVVEAPSSRDRGRDAAGRPSQPAVACTLWESEDKVRQLIYAMGDMAARDKSKADRIERQFREVFDRYLEPPSDPEPHRHEFCRTLDALLADLNR